MPASAGILLYVEASGGVRVLLAHPGGPYFAKKDLGAWTLPKGLLSPGEEPETAARREFAEELGWQPAGPLAPLGEVKLRSGKVVHAFALRATEPEQELLARFAPGTFSMEWPPKSSRRVEFPEVDRVAFFSLEEARVRLNPAQAALIGRLERLLRDRC